VLGNVMTGVAAKKAILDRYNELMMNYSDETADEMAKLQDQIDARTCGTSTARSSRRWTRSLPARRCRRRQALGRRDAPRRALPLLLASPTCCCSTSRPTISTPKRRPGSKRHLREFRARC
jgi:hypothetical protein